MENIEKESLALADSDTWREIAMKLDKSSIIQLSLTDKWLGQIMEEDCIWKQACMRDFGIKTDPGNVSFQWKMLYKAIFAAERYAMTPREMPKIHETRRIGVIVLDSTEVLLAQNFGERLSLIEPKKGNFGGNHTLEEQTMMALQEKEQLMKVLLDNTESSVTKNMKTGIWVVDWNHIRIINHQGQEVIMVNLDARHVEYFLREGNDWTDAADYVTQAGYEIKRSVDRSTCAIFDRMHMADEVLEIFLGKWRKAPNGPVYLWSCNLPSSYETAHAVAVDYELKKPNRGLVTGFHTKSEGDEIIALRITNTPRL